MRINSILRLCSVVMITALSAPKSAFAQCATPIASFPYTEDFEATNGGYTPGGTSSDWTWGTPTKTVIAGAANGNKCWITGGLSGSAYNNSENSTLTSPCFDFSGLTNPQISFSVFWETERKFDGANLQYSTDDGANWTVLGASSDNSCVASSWYNNTGVTYLGSQEGWSGNIQPTVGSCQGGSGSGRWVAASHDLTFLAGQAHVIFRFRFGAGTTCNSYDGFAIDDIKISETPPNSGDFTYTCNSNRSVSFTSSAALCASSYAWDFNDPASGANNNSTAANPTHIFSTGGTYIVKLTISFASGPSVTIPHTVEVLDVSISELIPVFCNGDQTAVILATVTGGTGPYFYSWSTTPAQVTPDLSNIGAGTYTVVVNSASSCSTTASYTVTEPAALSVSTNITDATCNNNNGSILATVSNGTSPYFYTWSDGSTANPITGLAPGTYGLTVNDDNGCLVTVNNLQVKNISTPVIVSLGADITRCPGQTIILDPGPYPSYLWQDNSTGPTYRVTSTGTYWVTVTNSQGCTGSDTVNVKIACPEIYFPGAFTPNGDGRNDFFGPVGDALPLLQQYVFRVYDRYGQLVFYSTNPYKGWDGTMKGKPYNSGAFTWFATYTIQGKMADMQNGTVLLIR